MSEDPIVVDINNRAGMIAAGLGHLLDDAPFLRCDTCKRKMWNEESGATCWMLQPDGSVCLGRFGGD